MNDFYIGIDFGGTNIRIISYDYEAKKKLQYYKKPVKRCEDVYKEAKYNIVVLIDKICKINYPAKLAGIGVAIAALFNRNTGVIKEWPNNQLWSGFPLKEFLEQRYHVPVVLEDDANSAAMGEQLFGAGKGYTSLMYVTVSTGIGCGIILNNALITGENGWAGELGHIRVTENNVLCTCKAKGCLQAVASGPAILKRFRSKYAGNNSDLRLEDVAQLAKEGNSEANRVFYDAGRYIGGVIANAIMLLDISLVIVGGGVIQTGSVILKPIQEHLEKSLQSKRKVSILCSDMDDKNGVLGALALILRLKYGTKILYEDIEKIPQKIVG